MNGEPSNAAGWTAEQAKRQVADFNELCRYINRIADALGCANPQILEHLALQRAALEAAQGERDQLRRRTHEIQEAADKRWADDTRDWRWWQEAIKYADKLMANDPGIAFHSTVTRAALASVVQERDRVQADLAQARASLAKALAVVKAAQRYRNARIGRIPDGTQATAWVGLSKAITAFEKDLPAGGEVQGAGE